MVCFSECCFGGMYVKWCGVCNLLCFLLLKYLLTLLVLMSFMFVWIGLFVVLEFVLMSEV